MAAKGAGKAVDALTEKEAAGELARLADEIAGHDRRYHGEDAPTISDADYDALRLRNLAIEARFPKLKRSNSPTERVGAAPQAKFAEARHSVPMLSLENAFSDDDVRDFVEQMYRFLGRRGDDPIALTAEPKIDGLSTSVRYERGKLVLGATRGDGVTGEDVTANVRTIKDIPQKLPAGAPDVVEVRGEIYLGKKDFLKLNAQQEKDGKPLYVNARNTAAGSLRQKNPQVTASRPLRFFAYAWGEMSADCRPRRKAASSPRSASGAFKSIRSCGFAAMSTRRSMHIAAIEKKRAGLDYDIDGVVYKVDSIGAPGAPRLPDAEPALGDRPQVPGREGNDGTRSHRYPGRPHRGAHAGGASEAGQCRRRHRGQRNAPQRGLHPRLRRAMAKCCAPTTRGGRSTSVSATR